MQSLTSARGRWWWGRGGVSLSSEQSSGVRSLPPTQTIGHWTLDTTTIMASRAQNTSFTQKERGMLILNVNNLLWLHKIQGDRNKLQPVWPDEAQRRSWLHDSIYVSWTSPRALRGDKWVVSHLNTDQTDNLRITYYDISISTVYTRHLTPHHHSDYLSKPYYLFYIITQNSTFIITMKGKEP